MNAYHLEILKSALEARAKEVTEYQVNITNFTLAIERVGDDPDLREFKVNLEGLLESSILEQRKAKIMLDVIQSQLE
jgi:muramoyltetrapeptide carboxypeptidase LdcA involved in peptidoglycan recycling